MDVALRVAERVTMMHDGRVIVEGTPDGSARTRRCTTLYLGRGTRAMPDALLAIEGVNAYYAGAQALEDVFIRDRRRRRPRSSAATGMGKTTLCNAIVGIPPARVTGSIRFRGKELVGQPSYKTRS